MHPDYFILCNLILGSNFSWPMKEITVVMKSMGIRPWIDPVDIPGAENSYIACAGCGRILSSASYPVAISSCLYCPEENKPLKWKDEYLAPGDAKIKYIQSAFFWPSQWAMHKAITEILKWREDHECKAAE